jgi:hypothetical protein
MKSVNTIWFLGPSLAKYIWYANNVNLMELATTCVLTVNNDVIGFGGLSDKRLKTNIKDL